MLLSVLGAAGLGSPSFPTVVVVTSPVCDLNSFLVCVCVCGFTFLCAFGVSSARLLCPGDNTPLVIHLPDLVSLSPVCVLFIWLLCCPLSVLLFPVRVFLYFTWLQLNKTYLLFMDTRLTLPQFHEPVCP